MTADARTFAENLRAHLETLKRLRGAKPMAEGAKLRELKRWQAERLAGTYANVSAQPRYAAATAFFLKDLYGPKDFSARDREMLSILPVMSRVLPAKAVETAALSIEVEAWSETLDHRLAAVLPEGPIDVARYGEAYRASATREERLRQIALVVEVGHRLEALVALPFVFRTLKLMRGPAHLAGLGDLQDFLERGFEAFRDMRGAEEFLAIIDRCERAILERLFSGEPDPFSLPVSPPACP